jgi:hypothetical protein
MEEVNFHAEGGSQVVMAAGLKRQRWRLYSAPLARKGAIAFFGRIKNSEVRMPDADEEEGPALGDLRHYRKKQDGGGQ